MSKRADFEGDKKTPPKKVEQLEKALKKLQKERQFKEVEMRFDEEHTLWEVRCVNSQGAEHLINWELASTAEFRQLLSKYKQIGPYMEPPFVVESIAKAAPKNGDATEELSDAEREDAEKTQKKTRKEVPAKVGGQDEKTWRRSWRKILRASCATTCWLKARRISSPSVTRAWAK